MARHHIKQGSRQRVEQPFPNEHPAEIVLGCRTLEFEHTADSVQGMLDKFGLFTVIFIQEVHEDFQTTAGNEHLKCQDRGMAQEADEVRGFEAAFGLILLGGEFYVALSARLI